MITYYEYTGSAKEPWKFEKVSLGSINLLVGASGSGKTKFLNTLFNFCDFVSKGKPLRLGRWKIKVDTCGFEYEWAYEAAIINSTPQITKENLKRTKDGKTEIIVDRERGSFKFMDRKLPKLDSSVPSVNLLKEEDIIQPLHRSFSHVQRRLFHGDALTEATSFEPITSRLINHFDKNPSLDRLWGQSLTIAVKLLLFKHHFPELYDLSTDFFRQVFPFIQNTKVELLKDSPIPLGNALVPVFLIKEKGVNDWIPLQELSSGMQKVMLIVTDVLTLPGESVYLIDEYENSLGINAIDFLPQFLIEHGKTNQFLVTTHHPYLINSMPIKNWLVFNRRGSVVRIKGGKELENAFGKSKQKAFVQLLNDPFYSQGPA